MAGLPPASVEQQAVLENLHQGNVVVDSVAGSGKTTCNLHIADFFENTRPEWDVHCLLLTYNAKLKMETREKVAQLGFSRRMEVHSFHAFCVKYYSPHCFNDKAMVNMLNATRLHMRYPVRKMLSIGQPVLSPSFVFADYVRPIPGYDVVIIDEAQDMTPTLYELVCKVVADVCLARRIRCVEPLEPRLMILGDRHQSIYGFMDADERYIRFARELFSMWSFSTLQAIPTPISNSLDPQLQSIQRMPLWTSCKLTESFRITKPMSDFINKCMLQTDSPDEGHHIRSNKPSQYKPRYRVCDSFTNDTYAELDYYLNRCGYKADDIFVLAPSIKSPKCPARQLENTVKEKFGNRIQIYAPNDDDQRLDESILAGKLVFSTFHQAKGLERKCVIVFGFDRSYFKMYKRNYDEGMCPNELYVACTRASEHLSLIHHYRNEYLPFLSTEFLPATTRMFADREVCLGESSGKEDDAGKMFEISVTHLLDHLPERVLAQCMELVTICDAETSERGILIPGVESKVQVQHGNASTCSQAASTFESVSDINGTAIPMWYEYKLKGEMTIQKQIIGIEGNKDRDSEVYQNAVQLAMKVRANRREQEFQDQKSGEVEQNDLTASAGNLDNMEDSKKPAPERGDMDGCSTSDAAPTVSTVSELLELANHWQSYIGGYVFKVYQIKNYNWLSQSTLECCVARMARSLRIGEQTLEPKRIAGSNHRVANEPNKASATACSTLEEHETEKRHDGPKELCEEEEEEDGGPNELREERLANVLFELKLEMEGLPNYANRKLTGSIDCIDMNVDAHRVYEFKCTKELEVTHVLQLVCYAYLLQKLREGKAAIVSDVPDWVAYKLGYTSKQFPAKLDLDDPFDLSGPSCVDGKKEGADIDANSDSECSDCQLMAIQLEGDDTPSYVTEQQRLLDQMSQPAKRQRLEHVAVSEECEFEHHVQNGDRELEGGLELESGEIWSCHLYNILTDELKVVKCEHLNQVMAIILEAKFGQKRDFTDWHFKSKSEATKAKYYA